MKKLVDKNLNCLESNSANSEKTLSRRTGISSRRGLAQKSISQSEISRFFRNKNTSESKTVASKMAEGSLKDRKQSIEPDAIEDIEASVEKPKGHKRAFSSA